MSTRRFCIALLLLGSVLTSGCVSYEGVGLSRNSYINPYFQKYGRLPGETDYGEKSKYDDERSEVSRFTIIGTLSVYRGFKADTYQKHYDRYVEDFENWGVARPPSLSLDEFSQTMAGWTQLKGFHVPLLMSAYFPVLVSTEVRDTLEFQDPFTTVMFQASSDLVAAVTNEDGAFVVTKLLCRDKDGYHKCREQYHRGIYDAVTGQELKMTLKPSDDGKVMDPVTFKVIEPGQ